MSDFEKLKDELKLKLSEAKNSQEADILRTNILDMISTKINN